MALERVFSRKLPDFCRGSKSSSFFIFNRFFCSNRSFAEKGRPLAEDDDDSFGGWDLLCTLRDGEGIMAGGGGGPGIPNKDTIIII